MAHQHLLDQDGLVAVGHAREDRNRYLALLGLDGLAIAVVCAREEHNRQLALLGQDEIMVAGK